MSVVYGTGMYSLALMTIYTFLFFFFFQAEDGIRDYKVTGVQTCALPIYFRGAHGEGAGVHRPRPGAGRAAARGRRAGDERGSGEWLLRRAHRIRRLS